MNITIEPILDGSSFAYMVKYRKICKVRRMIYGYN